MEILSPSTRDEHARGGKLWDAYERHGVSHYWIVDNAQRTIALYSLVGEPYQAGSYGPVTLLRPGDILTSPLFPSLSPPVAHVFRDVRDRRRGR